MSGVGRRGLDLRPTGGAQQLAALDLPADLSVPLGEPTVGMVDIRDTLAVDGIAGPGTGRFAAVPGASGLTAHRLALAPLTGFASEPSPAELNATPRRSLSAGQKSSPTWQACSA